MMRLLEFFVRSWSVDRLAASVPILGSLWSEMVQADDPRELVEEELQFLTAAMRRDDVAGVALALSCIVGIEDASHLVCAPSSTAVDVVYNRDVWTPVVGHAIAYLTDAMREVDTVEMVRGSWIPVVVKRYMQEMDYRRASMVAFFASNVWSDAFFPYPMNILFYPLHDPGSRENEGLDFQVVWASVPALTLGDALPPRISYGDLGAWAELPLSAVSRDDGDLVAGYLVWASSWMGISVKKEDLVAFMDSMARYSPDGRAINPTPILLVGLMAAFVEPSQGTVLTPIVGHGPGGTRDLGAGDRREIYEDRGDGSMTQRFISGVDGNLVWAVSEADGMLPSVEGASPGDWERSVFVRVGITDQVDVHETDGEVYVRPQRATPGGMAYLEMTVRLPRHAELVCGLPAGA